MGWLHEVGASRECWTQTRLSATYATHGVPFESTVITAGLAPVGRIEEVAVEAEPLRLGVVGEPSHTDRMVGRGPRATCDGIELRPGPEHVDVGDGPLVDERAAIRPDLRRGVEDEYAQPV